jgi:hypothetical protein
VAEGGRIEPGTHARDPLRHVEYNAITDQAAQLIHDWEIGSFDCLITASDLREWTEQALAILREVAAGG